jgi:hypothetical protein
VVTQEKGIKYTLDVKANYPSVVFQVDGCIIRSGRKCDKLVLVNTKGESPEEWTQFFVELKGHDAIHGIEQLLDTAKNQIFIDESNKVRKARLVATSTFIFLNSLFSFSTIGFALFEGMEAAKRHEL